MATLVQLKLTDTKGTLNREIIVSESISMYNLHRVLQFCIKPAQTDSTVDGKEFTFKHVQTGKLVKAAKSTQLYRAPPNATDAEVHAGDSYLYKPADKGEYLVEVVDTAGGDDRFYVPRCIAGNTDVDKINKKLLTRRFTKTGTGKKKSMPGVWCPKGTPAHMIMGSHMAAMRDPL